MCCNYTSCEITYVTVSDIYRSGELVNYFVTLNQSFIILLWYCVRKQLFVFSLATKCKILFPSHLIPFYLSSNKLSFIYYKIVSDMTFIVSEH